MKSKPSSAANKKLIQEIVILVIVVIAVGGFTVLNLGKAKRPPAAAVKSLDTTFDDNALQGLQTKDTNYPDVTPSKSELGKPNPFAP